MKAMSAYGYEIVQTLIVDIEPDERVKRAMNEINAGMNMCLFSIIRRNIHLQEISAIDAVRLNKIYSFGIKVYQYQCPLKFTSFIYPMP